jgi:integrase
VSSLAKRRRRNSAGAIETTWRVLWHDATGKRRERTFKLKRQALAYQRALDADIAGGTDAARRISFAEAAQQWVDHQEDRVAAGAIERQTWTNQAGHVANHIAGRPIGAAIIADLRAADFETFKDDLMASHSLALARSVMATARAVCKWAQKHGAVGTNHAAAIRVTAPRATRAVPQRVPDRDSLARLAGAVLDHRQAERPRLIEALGLLAITTGLRISELRGLLIGDLDLAARPRVQVRRRADRAGRIGPCKSAAAYRTIPLSEATRRLLRRWVLAAPPTQRALADEIGGRLVFPTSAGTVIGNTNLARQWAGLLAGHGLASKDGRYYKARHTFHDLRHAAASMWIEAGLDGRAIQQLLGHSDITLTYNTYGHLFRDRWAAVNPGDLIYQQLGLDPATGRPIGA